MMEVKLPEQGIDLKKFLNDIEAAYIRMALERTENNIQRAAKLVGYKRTTFKARLLALGIYPDVPWTHKILRDPLGEFKIERDPNNVHRRWIVSYKGEELVRKRNLTEANAYLKRKLDDDETSSDEQEAESLLDTQKVSG